MRALTTKRSEFIVLFCCHRPNLILFFQCEGYGGVTKNTLPPLHLADEARRLVAFECCCAHPRSAARVSLQCASFNGGVSNIIVSCSYCRCCSCSRCRGLSKCTIDMYLGHARFLYHWRGREIAANVDRATLSCAALAGPCFG